MLKDHNLARKFFIIYVWRIFGAEFTSAHNVFKFNHILHIAFLLYLLEDENNDSMHYILNKPQQSANNDSWP